MSFKTNGQENLNFHNIFLEVPNNPYMFDISKSETHLTTCYATHGQSHVAHTMEVWPTPEMLL